MNKNILDSGQFSAVYLPPNQSVIIEAPPGHGKTFVMARRIEYLIQSGYIKSPNKILGLTFTNAAAGEMQDDIKKRIFSENLDLIRVMTFHSFSYKVLRAYGNFIGITRDFEIISENEQNILLNKVFAQSSISKEEYIIWFKEKYKNIQTQDAELSDKSIYQEYYKKYISELGLIKIDYDHILIKLVELFTKFPNILEIYRSVFQYILVDEFQDTNPLQYKILMMLVFGLEKMHQKRKEPTPIFILADKNQAIYRFQGATPENIQRIKKDIQCHEIILDTNYRCNNENILRLIMKFRNIDIDPSNDKVELNVSLNPTDEAQLIYERINEYKNNLHDICVIAQTEFQLIAIRSLLEKNGKPYVFVPDFRSNSIERKYQDAFDRIKLLPFEKNYNGKLSQKIRQICGISTIEKSGDDVLNALYMLAVNFENRSEKAPFAVQARQFYNDIFIQIHWGNLLRKTVRNKIFLSSIHGVKGLQFHQVHLCGLSSFEHIYRTICFECNFGKNIISISDKLFDAKNTLYVGISRAQTQLFLYSTEMNDKQKIRRIICLLSPYKEFITVVGNGNFCSELL